VFDLLSVNSRGTGTIIKVGLSAVEKKYTQDDRAACVQHLQENVDVLMQYYVNDNVHGSVEYLQLKGVDIFLHWGQEVLGAAVCIQQALKVCQYGLRPELLQVD